MPSSIALLKVSRQIHTYFGLFIAPALLFFAFTGAVQTLSLHEAAGSAYKPPAILAVWGQIHKKQTWVLPVRRQGTRDVHDAAPAHTDAPSKPAEATTARPADSPGPGQGAHAHGPAKEAAPAGMPQAEPATASPSKPQQPQTLWSKQKQHLPLKIFFLVASLGLFTSTFTGIYMAYRYDRNKLLVTGLLVAGVVVPLVLLPF